MKETEIRFERLTLMKADLQKASYEDTSIPHAACRVFKSARASTRPERSVLRPTLHHRAVTSKYLIPRGRFERWYKIIFSHLFFFSFVLVFSFLYFSFLNQAQFSV